MKIVYYIHNLTIKGGLERILVDKMNYLADNLGYEVYVVTASQGEHKHAFPLSPKVIQIDLGIRFHDLYKYRYPIRLLYRWQYKKRFKKEFGRVIGQLRPDLMIGITYYRPDWLCSSSYKCPRIVESHVSRCSFTNDGIKRNKFIQYYLDHFEHPRFFKCVEKSYDVVVCLTESDKKDWERANKAVVIPNSVHPIDYKPYNSRTNRVIAAGRLAYQKGFDILILAWQYVKERHPDWILDIYGSGSLEMELSQQIQALSLSDCVHLNPATDHIFEEYSKSSLFVLSSRFEGFGLVLVEAMSCGLPCVSFDCPYGPADIIEHEKNGLLVKNGDAKALADAICRMIEDEDLRSAYSKNARDDVRKYSQDVIMAQWDRLFKELVQK